MIPVTELAAVDTTGAGDMFFAGMVATLANNPQAPKQAATRGVEAATGLLRERLASMS
jgi:ribokinase